MGPLGMFTPEDDARIREWYAAYVPVPDIARQLGRSVGVIRQRILTLELRRDRSVYMCLKWAPDHLKSRVTDFDPLVFRDTCFAWRREQQAAAIAGRRKQVAKACSAIDRDRTLDRDAKIRAKRKAGATLQVIADQHGLTRERVRQLTTSGWEVAGYNKEARANRNAKIRAEWLAGASRQAIARQHGLSVTRVRQLTRTV